jgi:glucuronate isomerase
LRVGYTKWCVNLPLFSPHGHVDLRLLLDGEPFSDSATLFVTPEHYVTRLRTPTPTANVGSYSLLMRHSSHG